MASVPYRVPVCREQTFGKIPRRSVMLDLQDPGYLRILNLTLLFSHGILDIKNPATSTLSWDPRDLGSQTDKILLDPGDSASCLGKPPWYVVDLGACTAMMSLYLETLLHPMKFCFWFSSPYVVRVP